MFVKKKAEIRKLNQGKLEVRSNVVLVRREKNWPLRLLWPNLFWGSSEEVIVSFGFVKAMKWLGLRVWLNLVISWFVFLTLDHFFRSLEKEVKEWEELRFLFEYCRSCITGL